MPSFTHIRNAHSYGRAIATNLFASMLNPKYRGSEFRWEKFEEMVVRRTRAQFGLHVVCNDRDKGALLTAAQEEAGFQARMLLRESGVQEWLACP